MRAELVEKWTRLGQEYIEDEEALLLQMDQRIKVVDTIIWKNLVPPYPLFVLHILQQLEAQSNLETAPSAYAFIYESLVANALAALPRNPTLDTRYTLLSYIAFRAFSENRRSFSVSDVATANAAYYSKYKVKVDVGVFLGEISLSA